MRPRRPCGPRSPGCWRRSTRAAPCLRAAIETGSDRVRAEVIAAVGVLGAGFAELGFLVADVARAAAQIQASLDEQGANVRVIIEQNLRQSAEIRLARQDLAAIERRTRGGPGRGGCQPGGTVGGRVPVPGAAVVRGDRRGGFLRAGAADHRASGQRRPASERRRPGGGHRGVGRG